MIDDLCRFKTICTTYCPADGVKTSSILQAAVVHHLAPHALWHPRPSEPPAPSASAFPPEQNVASIIASNCPSLCRAPSSPPKPIIAALSGDTTPPPAASSGFTCRRSSTATTSFRSCCRRSRSLLCRAAASSRHRTSAAAPTTRCCRYPAAAADGWSWRDCKPRGTASEDLARRQHAPQAAVLHSVRA